MADLVLKRLLHHQQCAYRRAVPMGRTPPMSGNCRSSVGIAVSSRGRLQDPRSDDARKPLRDRRGGEISKEFKSSLHGFSSNSLRRIYRHCRVVPSAEQPIRPRNSAGVPNVRPSIHSVRCARSSNREAIYVGPMVGPARLPVAAPAEPVSQQRCSRRALRLWLHRPCCPRSRVRQQGTRWSWWSRRFWLVRVVVGRKPNVRPARRRNPQRERERHNRRGVPRKAGPGERRPKQNEVWEY